MKDGSMYFTIAMISGTIFAASATILMITFRTPLLIALGANSETLKLASDYLIGYVLLAVFNVASIVITGFIRCDGAPRLAGTASLVGSLSNILLDVVFVYGLRWGMFGAAFATGLSPVVTLICCCPYFIKKQNQFKLTAVTEPAKRIFDILKLGFPSFIAGIASSFTMLVFNKQLLKLGGNLH